MEFTTIKSNGNCTGTICFALTSQIHAEGGTIWKHIRVFKAKPQHIPPLINGNEILESTSQTAEELARHLKQIYMQPSLPYALSLHLQINSTTHVIARITKKVYIAYTKKQPAGALLLDLTRAFDSVHHGALIENISSPNTSRHIIHLLYSFLTNKSFQVRIENQLLSSHHAAAGVKQGSLLSPILFALYI
ncbi:hypothetical protein PR048_022682 [Dryococelus australis]|uniref:Reverse transcriptase domain-containing protein n=1 Tax=Dryococelus australis TaxID=614101 RepID=A0ABQ9GRZ6_9NEOP|nr:hypothetical protein PR048_022682 [Dryococelus australis]